MARIETHEHPRLPREPIDALVDPLRRFMHIESAGGVVLLAATVVALILANSPLADSFLSFWKTKVGFTFGSFQMEHSLSHWINDLLMAVFFYVIGLEVKRELLLGELREFKKATLPLMAALGGMIAPALIYLSLQAGEPGQRGWGIPMATDIAFVVGCMAVLGPRIPRGLRVFLLSLAIVDDIGAILVIAIGYTETIHWSGLALSAVSIGVLLVLMKIGVRNVAVFVIFGLVIWFGFHESGVHATIAGVIVGLLTPVRSWVSEGRLDRIIKNTLHFMQGEGWSSSDASFEKLRELELATRKTVSPLKRMETLLHPWVGFVIMPLFALANAGVRIEMGDFANPVAFAVMLGLIVGKPLGVMLFSFVAVKLGIGQLPEGVNWRAMVGAGCLAGIGFTMAIFIAGLALQGDLLDAAKVGILAGSILSAVLGVVILIGALPKPETVQAGH
ncbi:MAG: Na+/H+ antiporter NhaA [Bacteroidota bacterium]